MSMAGSCNSGGVGGSQNQGSYTLVGSDALSLLDQRVSAFLSQEDNKDKIDPQEVLKAISNISQQPIPGANHSFLA